MSLLFRILLLSFLLNSLIDCSSKDVNRIPGNLNHALNLVDSTVVEGETLMWIAIYAEAPGYAPVAAKGEGITCVDDVGRFMNILEFEIRHHQRRDLIPVAEGMVRFLLYLSREDGLWYNFMFKDGSINKEYRTSVASFGWWAVRGLRGLGAGYRIFENQSAYKNLVQRITNRFLASQPRLDSLFSSYPRMVKVKDGTKRPGWNLKNAPDQSAELLLALASVQGLGEFDYHREIRYLAEALLGWQFIKEQEPYSGMYFCWQNTWHGWGNNQALALLKAYALLGDEHYLNSVRLWADHFVPALIQRGFPAEIKYDSLGNWQVRDYPQIAYGLSATYRGMQALATLTGFSDYQRRAEQVFAWFKGQNAAMTRMYDPESGRFFDGITAVNEVNRNSGAESTIEGLLAIQARGGW